MIKWDFSKGERVFQFLQINQLIYNSNKLKNRYNTILSKDAEKIFGQIPYLFMIKNKTKQKLYREWV